MVTKQTGVKQVKGESDCPLSALPSVFFILLFYASAFGLLRVQLFSDLA